jgi:D-serine deaminase-like pyridoxal phosphate-dependent protein
MHITKPTLLISKSICQNNIGQMAQKARQNNCKFRPHFKTHQSALVGQLFREAGITQITVSSVSMAVYFAAQGWNDITIAFPVNILELEQINALAEKIKLSLLVESAETLAFLNEKLEFPVSVFIKIDTAYHRTGIAHHDTKSIDALLLHLQNAENLHFKGFLSHAGHSYQTSGVDEIIAIHEDTRVKMVQLKQRYLPKFPGLILSVGDTPTCSLATDFTWADEMRPGNFVYYDYMQFNLGSCAWEQIAVAVACPVVALHPERDEVIVYGGAVHLSKEAITSKNQQTVFGRVAATNGTGWGQALPDCYVKKLSQEHGTLHVPKELANKFKVGDLAFIVPVHSCLTANLLKDNQIIG